MEKMPQMQSEQTEIKKDENVLSKEKITEYNNQGESFLNPENMPPLPVSNREKQRELLVLHREYQQLVSGLVFEKALRPNMTDEEIDLLVKGTLEKRQREENEEKDEIAEDEYIEQAEENKKEVPANIDEQQISVITRAVELMQGYLKDHPKLAKFAMFTVVAAELAGNSAPANADFGNVLNSLVYAGQNMMQNQLYAQQQSYQTQGYAQQNMQQSMSYAQNMARQVAEQGSYNARSFYDNAMMQAGQSRINTYNSLGRQATREEAANIEASYQAQVKDIENQARQMAESAQMQANQIMQNAQMQAQNTAANANMNIQNQQMNAQMQNQNMVIQTGANILMQAIGGGGGHWGGGQMNAGRWLK